MKVLFLSFSLLLLLTGCSNSQSGWQDKGVTPRLVGGPCEGCEGVLEFGNRPLQSVDTLPGFEESQTKIKVEGTIFKPDGKTPAQGVILYIYQTNEDGVYPTKGDETNWARRHGYIRAWLKTDQQGRYAFYTMRPGSYPNRAAPAHIHPTILEPDGRYYWVDDFNFEDDPLMTANERSKSRLRGGSSGILELTADGNLQVGRRDFILGKNIPQYE